LFTLIPLGRFVKWGLGAAAFFGIFGSGIANAADQMKNATSQINYFSRGLAELFGENYGTIGLVVEIKKATAEEAFKTIEQVNRELLYKINREEYGAWWNSPTLGLDALAFLNDWETAFVIAIKNTSNAFYDFVGRQFNDVIELVNYFRDEPIQFRFEEDSSSISVVEQMLEKIDPTLRIGLDIPDDQLKFISEETLGEIVSTAATVANYRARISELNYDEWISTEARDQAIDQAERELKIYEDAAQQLTVIAQIEARRGAGQAKIQGTYNNFTSQTAKTNSLFGEQLIKVMSIKDYLKLGSDGMREYTALSRDAQDIQSKIQMAWSNTLLSEDARNRLVQDYVKQLEKVAKKMNDINKVTESFTRVDAGDMFGLDPENLSTIISQYSDEMDQVKTIAERIKDIDKDLRDKGLSEAFKESLQLEKAELEREGQRIADGINRKLRTPLENMISDLSEAGVTLTRLDLVSMTGNYRQTLASFSESLSQLKDAENKATLAGNKLLAEQIRIVYEKTGKEAGAVLAEATREAFDPTSLFQRIGIEQLGRMPEESLKAIVTQAEALAEQEALNAAARQLSGKVERDQIMKQLELQGALNDMIEEAKALYDFEALGDDIGGAVVRGIKNGNIGEEITNVFLDAIMNNLQDQISAFATGFLETFFGGLEAAEGAGGAVADILKGVLGMDPSVAKGSEEAGTVLAEKVGGVTAAIKEQTGGLLEGFGGIFGNIFQSLSGLFSGGGGAGGLLSLFAGFFDDGGSIPANKFGIVGERGPELVSGPSTVYSRAQTARELEKAGNGGKSGGNVTFALEGDFDTRAERSIRRMINSGMMQSALNGAEVENGGNQPIFRTP